MGHMSQRADRMDQRSSGVVSLASVEKNRGGLADLSMEFERRFQEGRMVQEQLIEERVCVE